MTEATCKTCRWWRKNEYQSPSAMGEFLGHCRIRSMPTFPERYASDWCGEHSERKPLPTVEGVTQ